MAVSKETRSYIDGLVEYYISEAESYLQIAKLCNAEGAAVDTTIGMIVGCIYSAFLQSCTERSRPPELDEINDIVQIIRSKIPDIKRAIVANNNS